jgi:AraC-like DNA-binding protein
VDVLSEVLRSLRVNASIYCALDLSAPWGISLPKSSWAPFHFLESGSCWLLRDGGKRIRLDAGDVVVLFNSQGHRLCDVPSTRPETLDRVIRHKNGQGTVSFGGGGALTRLICGKFVLDEREGPPGSLRHLPEVLHLRRQSWQQFSSFSDALRLLAHEVRSRQPGGELAARFLTEVLLIQVLRVLVNGGGTTAKGWLEGLRDPPIASALAAIHAKPEHPWSLESLAETAGLSRAVFAARFRERIGQTPMAYVSECRLRLASQWLEETDLSVSEVFQRLGYASAAAFNRAFKRKYGLPPSAYRRDRSRPELRAS